MKVKQFLSTGSISILLCLIPSATYAHSGGDPIYLLVGIVHLIGPILLGGILLRWKRKELVINRGTVAVIFLCGIGIMNWGKLFWFSWFERLPILINVFVIPFGWGFLLSWCLYRWYRHPIFRVETSSGA